MNKYDIFIVQSQYEAVMTHISMDMQSPRFSKGVGQAPSTACKEAAMDYKGVPKCEQAIGKK